jgi:hypothetical protein
VMKSKWHLSYSAAVRLTLLQVLLFNTLLCSTTRASPPGLINDEMQSVNNETYQEQQMIQTNAYGEFLKNNFFSVLENRNVNTKPFYFENKTKQTK